MPQITPSVQHTGPIKIYRFIRCIYCNGLKELKEGDHASRYCSNKCMRKAEYERHLRRTGKTYAKKRSILDSLVCRHGKPKGTCDMKGCK